MSVPLFVGIIAKSDKKTKIIIDESGFLQYNYLQWVFSTRNDFPLYAKGEIL